jgi:dihydroorotase
VGTVLLRNGRALHVHGVPARAPVDLGIGADGTVAFAGRVDGRGAFDTVVDLRGAWVSPAWIDLHVHCYYGATWLSLRPEQVGPATGVGLAVDCGSAGEANFAGFREFIAGPQTFPIRAFLNISTIGLVAADRVSEFLAPVVMDPERTAECAARHPDLIRGIKVRASGDVVGVLGMAPVRVAKAVAASLRLPLVVHIAQAPPSLDEILDVLEPDDVLTHCFTGCITTSLARHDRHFRRVHDAAAAGLTLDIGHGQGSFDYRVARHAIGRGLLPGTISTDLHIGCAAGPVWDLPTTMSKLLALGMTEADVVERVTARPARVLKLEDWGAAAPGVPARFTVFDVREGEAEQLPDAFGGTLAVERFFEPRYTIVGTAVTPAARMTDRRRVSTSIASGRAAAPAAASAQNG